MRKRIKQLDPLLVNQIAAGEVIERPASCVKELLENAVDSGATQIDVVIRDGGVEEITVIDNGSGIFPEDLPLAFSSHATSKLTQPADLEHIATLGFRGEAIASIASVAQVSIQSRVESADAGAELACNGGQLGEVRIWNGRPGTRVSVKHIFYNTPARRKFLKSTATEMGHISEAVTRIALGFPEVGIRLRHNDREVYSITADTPLDHRITLLFGEEIGNKLLGIRSEGGPSKLTGFVADPSVSRGNSRFQYFFVNGRCIRDRTLGHALQEAFHGLIMVGRYPIGFLYLTMPNELVDVNVHPAKAEVRFLDSHAIHHFVRSAVRMVLHRENLQPIARPMPSHVGSGSGNWTLSQPSQVSQPRFGWPQLASTGLPSRILNSTPPTPTSVPSASLPKPSLESRGREELLQTGPSETHRAERLETPPIHFESLFTESQRQAIPQPRVLQLHQAYLVVEEAEGMLVVDQHALHERILYEELRERIGKGELETQGLLIPEPVDLTPDQKALAIHHQDALAKVGLPIQDFGGNTILVSGVPAILKRAKPDGLLRMAVEHLSASENAPTPERLYDNLLRLMACHAAVKAGDNLSEEEIHALLNKRHSVADSHHCPHGRPTSLFFSRTDLDKQFERI